MAWWTDLIKIAVPAVVDMFSGKDQPAQSNQTKDDQGNLVAKPIPGKLPERERVKPWTSMGDFVGAGGSGMARPVGATPALKSSSPSEVNSRYWAAIYSDAKRRSEIR